MISTAASEWNGISTATICPADPLGFEAGDANLTRYVGNEPTNTTDPSGLMPNRNDATTADKLVKQIEELEKAYPDDTPLQILERVRNAIKGPSNPNRSESGSPSADESKKSPGSDYPPGGINWGYIYTEEHGWIDLGHFFEAATWADNCDDWLVIGYGFWIECWQAMEGVACPDHPGIGSSAFGPEDLTSNAQGAWFGDAVTNSTPLSEQVRVWFQQHGAKDPKEAPDWKELPQSEAEHEKKWRDSVDWFYQGFEKNPPPLYGPQ